MDKDKVFVLLNLIFIFIFKSVFAASISDLSSYQSDDPNSTQHDNRNPKLKIVLDSVRFKISDSYYLECPIGLLKPATFMFLRKEAVDFITRFSIQLNETFESAMKRKRKDNLSSLFSSESLTGFNDEDDVDENGSMNDEKQVTTNDNKLVLNCRWLSSDLNHEFGNFTLYLNKPTDNQELNNHLFKYFDARQDHSEDAPKIISSANKILKRKVGSKVNFLCDFNQATNIKVTWYRKDNNGFINLNDEMRTNQNALDITNYKITSNRLTIKEITDTDFAEYICRISNDYGEDYAFYRLESTESKQHIETVVQSFDDVHLKENKSILLNCSIKSYGKFSVEWFESIDCNKFDCQNGKYSYLFVDNNEFYKPLLNTNSALVNYNKIQYMASYFIDKKDQVPEKKFICMVRNQNGFNYKIMTLRVNDKLPASSLLTFADSKDSIAILIVSSIAISVFLVILVIVVIVTRRTRNNKKNNKIENGYLNNLNTINRTRSQNDYLNLPNRNKALHDKAMKNSTLLINNLIQQGRNAPTLNHIDISYSSQHINKFNRSKLSSVANSFQRLNTPVQDDSFSCENI